MIHFRKCERRLLTFLDEVRQPYAEQVVFYVRFPYRGVLLRADNLHRLLERRGVVLDLVEVKELRVLLYNVVEVLYYLRLRQIVVPGYLIIFVHELMPALPDVPREPFLIVPEPHCIVMRSAILSD